MTIQIHLHDTQLNENDAGAVVGTLSIESDESGTPTPPLPESPLSVSSLNGKTGFRLNGVDAGDHSGYSVSSAGDVNGDGFGDIVVGTSPAGGTVRLFFGGGT